MNGTWLFLWEQGEPTEGDEALLSVSERAYLGTLGRPRRRAQSLRARVLVRKGLGHVGALPHGFEIVAQRQGAPQVRGGCWASLSHSGALVAAVASFDGPCGVDVEGARIDRDYRALADAAWGPSETAWTAASFYEAWCVREARYKAAAPGSTWSFRWGGYQGAVSVSGDHAPACWVYDGAAFRPSNVAFVPGR